MTDVRRRGPQMPRRESGRRLLIVANSSPHQTTARLLSVLASRLRDLGHASHLQLRGLPAGIAPKLLRLVRSEHQHIARLRHADALVVHTPLALSLPTIIAARLLRRRTLAFVWDLHPESNRIMGSSSSTLLMPAFWLLERLALLLSSQLLIATDDYRPFLGRFGAKTSVLPLWPCDPVVDVSGRRPSRDGGILRLAFAGQINSVRGLAGGIDEVLRSWSGESVELHVFSADRCPEGIRLRSSSDPRLTVIEHGFLDPVQLQDRLAGLDLGWVCLDSNFHLPAFPSKILAYLCAGLPVLYTGPTQPALQQWITTYKLAVPTSPGGVIDPPAVRDLRHHLQARRADYFAEVDHQWRHIDRLL